ncbi:MAG: sigma-70 family RNA polymerase sigma factor [Deltaproteobacteria bacterium]|nr:sigma-70 family RNA polymerase sigma factor [Deltaproteobacteria bacterium]
MTPADADLVARVLVHDDRHAFATLVRNHQSPVRLFLRRLCRDDALADDLAQETFVRVWRHLGSWRREARFQTWLFQVAYNLFLSELRRRRPTEALSADGEAVDAVQAPRGDAVHLQHDVAHALAVLSLDERAAITLCFQHGLTHQEAAEVLAMPLGTVKTHVLRGREKLRKRLGAWEGAGAP